MSWFTSDSMQALAWREVSAAPSCLLLRMTHITTAQRKLHPSGGHFSLDDQRCGVSCKSVCYAETLTAPDRCVAGFKDLG